MPGKWRTGNRLVALTICAAALLQAGPPLTPIQDTLYKADGTRFEGVAQIEWKSFRAFDGSEVPQQVLNVRVTNGNLRLALVPTVNAERPVTYTVKFNADGRTQFVEHWAVPASVAAVKLKDIRTNIAQSANIIVGNQVAITEVSGLRTELDLRPAKGAGYTAARAAVINASGALEGAAGSSGDCIRVDGSSGPCGTGGLLFVDSETPSGATNGSNRVFQLSAPPSPPGSLALYRSGMLLKDEADYTVTGQTITLVSQQTPRSTDRLQAFYRLDPTGTTSIEFVDGEVPSGAVNGSNRVFNLAGTPMPAASLRVFRNGLLQAVGVDYNLSVNVLTFLPGSVPVVGDIVQVSYRQ